MLLAYLAWRRKWVTVLTWKPLILAIGFKSKTLLYAFRVVFFNMFCLMGRRKYELIIVKYVAGQPPANWPKLLERIRKGKVRLLPALIKVVVLSEVPLEVPDELTVVYLSPQVWDEEGLVRLREFCLDQLIAHGLTTKGVGFVIGQ